MKRIKLTRGKFALVDAQDYKKVSSHKWRCKFKITDRTAYACSSTGKLMHRFILEAAKGQVVDHKNRNGLDNRRKNIRIVSRNQNQWNMAKHDRNTSSFKGVFYSKGMKRRKRFYAAIRCHGKDYCKGMFLTAKEASVAYLELAQKLHGEFARD